MMTVLFHLNEKKKNLEIGLKSSVILKVDHQISKNCKKCFKLLLETTNKFFISSSEKWISNPYKYLSSAIEIINKSKNSVTAILVCCIRAIKIDLHFKQSNFGNPVVEHALLAW